MKESYHLLDSLTKRESNPYLVDGPAKPNQIILDNILFFDNSEKTSISSDWECPFWDLRRGLHGMGNLMYVALLMIYERR